MITVTFQLDQPNWEPHTEELINIILKDAFRMYHSLVPGSIKLIDSNKKPTPPKSQRIKEGEDPK